MGWNVLKDSDLTLKQIETELQELLNGVNPLDKLKVGNKYTIEKDGDINGFNPFKKGQVVEVLEIIPPSKEWKTTTIKYSLDGGPENVLSDGIFILTFCKDLKLECDNYDKKLKELRRYEKELKKSFESDWLDHTVELQKLSIFKQVIKILMKKLGLKKD